MTTITAVDTLALSRQVQRVAVLLARCVERSLAAVGLTLPQVVALDLISQADGPMTVTGLAAALRQEQQGMTGLVDRLERQGLVRRVRDLPDRRAIRLEVTEAGRAMLTAALPVEQACATDLFCVLSPAALLDLTTTLGVVERHAS